MSAAACVGMVAEKKLIQESPSEKRIAPTNKNNETLEMLTQTRSHLLGRPQPYEGSWAYIKRKTVKKYVKL